MGLPGPAPEQGPVGRFDGLAGSFALDRLRGGLPSPRPGADLGERSARAAAGGLTLAGGRAFADDGTLRAAGARARPVQAPVETRLRGALGTARRRARPGRSAGLFARRPSRTRTGAGSLFPTAGSGI